VSRTRRLVGGLAVLYGYQGLLILTGLWLTPFYLARIGQHDYGLWLMGTQLLTYLTLTDFGVVALLPIETAYATGRAGGADKAADLPEIIGQTVRIVMYQLPIVLIVALAMWLSIPAGWQGLKGPLGVVLLTFVVGFPLRILPALLQGLQDLTFANGLQTFAWALGTGSTVLMVLANWSLYALALGWLISQFALAPIAIYRLMTRFPGVLPRKLPPLAWNAARTQLGKGFWISVAQVAQLLTTATDLLILGRVLGPAAVVPYSCTGKLPGVLGNQATILMHTAGPAICELRTGETRQRVFQAMAALSQGLLTFSGLVFCVVLVVNHWFVNWWVTARQYGGLPLTVVILLTMLIRHFTMTTGYIVFFFGHQRRISLTNLADGLVTAGCCFVLTAFWGGIGTAAGLGAGAVLVSLPLNLHRIALDTESNWFELLRAMSSGWFSRFVLLAAAAAFVASRWSPKNLFEGAAASVCVAAIYSLVMLPNILHSTLGNYIRPLASAFREKFTGLPQGSQPEPEQTSVR